jgi:hypothetical protein
MLNRQTQINDNQIADLAESYCELIAVADDLPRDYEKGLEYLRYCYETINPTCHDEFDTKVVEILISTYKRACSLKVKNNA